MLFYGRLSEFNNCKLWPEKTLISVVNRIQENAVHFLEELRTARSGFYYINAEEEKERDLLESWDYRNSTARGLTLFLAASFKSEQAFIQAAGRIRRNGDEGQLHVLLKRMWDF